MVSGKAEGLSLSFNILAYVMCVYTDEKLMRTKNENSPGRGGASTMHHTLYVLQVSQH